MPNSRIRIINRGMIGVSLELAAIGEFRVSVTSRLPHFDVGFAQAYALDEDNGRYALVFFRTDCVRIHDMFELRALTANGLEIPEKFGLTTIGDREHFVMVMPRPSTISMYERIVVNGFDHREIRLWLLEIFDILHIIHDHGIMHGSLNGGTIRVGKDDHIMVGSCFISHCGAEQLDVFETIARSRCHTYGKNTHDLKADYYAVGILLLELIAGKQFLQTSKAELIYGKITYGSFFYACHVLGINHSNLDPYCKKLLFIASKLLDDASENRWGWLQSVEFLGATREDHDIDRLLQEIFSTSEKIRECQDGMVFNNMEHENLTTLAVSLEGSWDEAKAFIKSGRIMRWLLQAKQFESSTISSFNRMYVESSKYGSNSNPTVISREDAMLAYLIAHFADQHIISFRGVTFHISTIGSILKYASFSNSDEITGDIILLVNSGLLANIVAFAGLDRSYVGNIEKLLRSHHDIRYIVYTLNWELPHLLFGQYVCFCPLDVISVLEDDKELKSIEHIPIMRDLLLFLAARLHLGKVPEIVLPQGLQKIHDERLFTLLRLLAMGQGAINAPRTAGLFAEALLDMVTPLLHGIKARNRLAHLLDKAGTKGMLSSVLKVLNQRSIKNNYARYSAALTELHKMMQDQEELVSCLESDQVARNYGHLVAIKLAVFIWACTIVFFLSQII